MPVNVTILRAVATVYFTLPSRHAMHTGLRHCSYLFVQVIGVNSEAERSRAASIMVTQLRAHHLPSHRSRHNATVYEWLAI